MVYLRYSVCMLVLSLAASEPGRAQQWHDPSKHNVQFVIVEDGVQLEVLDLGRIGAAHRVACRPWDDSACFRRVR
jgi:hypothetical protein